MEAICLNGPAKGMTAQSAIDYLRIFDPNEVDRIIEYRLQPFLFDYERVHAFFVIGTPEADMLEMMCEYMRTRPCDQPAVVQAREGD